MVEKKAIRVRTFTTELKIFETMRELESLDNEVNLFILQNGIRNVVSVSDTTTTDSSGATIGVIRVLAYEA